MAFFENLTEMISTKGKEAAEATKKMAEVANLKGQISGIEGEIKKNYRKIGEAYYEAYKCAEVTCEFEEYVQTIRDAKKAVEELKRKINEIKGDVECKGCGSQIKVGSSFCPNCGTKVEEEFFDEEDENEGDIVSEIAEDVEEMMEEVVEETEVVSESEAE